MTDFANTLSMYMKIHGHRQVVQALKETVAPMRNLKAAAKIFAKGGITEAGKRGFLTQQQAVKRLNSEIKKLSLKPFRFELLSIMFFSMLVWRNMIRLFSSMIETIKTLGGKFHPVNLALTKMAVAWEIIKYTLINALGPLFLKVADWLIAISEGIQDMDPVTMERIAIALGAIAVLSGLTMIATQIGLMAGGVATMVTKAGGLAALAATLAKIGAIAFPIVIGFLFNKEEVIEDLKSLWENLKKGNILKFPLDVFNVIMDLNKGMVKALGWLFQNINMIIPKSIAQFLGVVAGTIESIKNKIQEKGFFAGIWDLFKPGTEEDLKQKLFDTFGLKDSEQLMEELVKEYEEGRNMIISSAGEVKNLDFSLQTANTTADLMLSPLSNITGEIDAAGMSAEELNAALSQPITKHIYYVHHNKDGDGNTEGSDVIRSLEERKALAKELFRITGPAARIA